MGINFSDYGAVTRQFLSDEIAQDHIDLARNELDLSTTIQPEIDDVKTALDTSKQKLLDLDTKRAELGLPDDFFEGELESLENLNERMKRHFIAELKGVSELNNSILNGHLGLNEASSIATRVPEQASQLLTSLQIKESFLEDLNWGLVSELSSLKPTENLHEVYHQRSELIAEYENLRNLLTKGPSSLSELALHLQEKNADLITYRNHYLNQLEEVLGFNAQSGYSSILSYLQYPRDVFENARKIDAGDPLGFDQLKSIGFEVQNAIKSHYKFLVIEAYIRLKLYKEYADYISLRGHFSDLDLKKLKLNLANALKLGDYFWGFSAKINQSVYVDSKHLQELEKNVDRAYEILPRDLTLAIDEVSIQNLVKILHDKDLIVEKIQKPNKSKTSKGSLDLFSYSLKPQPESQNRFFEVNFEKLKKISIDDVVTNFVRESNFSLEGVLGLFENPYFKVSNPRPLFLKKEHLALFGDPSNRGKTFSIQQYLDSIAAVDFSILQNHSSPNTNLAGYAAIQVLYYQKAIHEYREKLSDLENRADRLVSKLPIGFNSDESIAEKLHKVANFLLAPATDIQSEYKGKILALRKEIEEGDSLASLDRIRDFFIDHLRALAKDRYSFHKEQINSLEKEQITKSNDLARSQEIGKLINQHQIELNKLDGLTANLSNDIYHFYRSIYDPKFEGSLISSYLKLIYADKKHAEFETLNSLLVDLSKAAPSLIRDVEQIILTLRTDVAIRAHLACLDAQMVSEGADFDKEVDLNKFKYEVLKNDYEKDDEASKKNEFYVSRIKEIALRGATLELQKKWTQEKISNLTGKISEFREFDPRSVPEDYQEAFFAHAQVSNPEIQMWVDLKKKESSVLNRALDEIQSLENFSTKSDELLGDKQLEALIIDALEQLDKEGHFFDIDKSEVHVSYPVLKPILSHVSKFSETSLVNAVVYTFNVSKKILFSHHQDEIKELSYQNYIDKAQKLESKMSVAHAKLVPLKESLEKELASLKTLDVELASANAWPDRKLKLKDLSENLNLLKALKADVKVLEARYQNILNTSLNSEIEKTTGAQKLLERQKERLKNKFESENSKLIHLDKLVKEQSLVLEIELKGKTPKAILIEIDSELNLEKPSKEELMQKIKSQRKIVLEFKKEVEAENWQFIDSEDKLGILKEIYENEEFKKDSFEKLKILKQHIEHRAVSTAFKIFGFNFNEEEYHPR